MPPPADSHRATKLLVDQADSGTPVIVPVSGSIVYGSSNNGKFTGGEFMPPKPPPGNPSQARSGTYTDVGLNSTPVRFAG